MSRRLKFADPTRPRSFYATPSFKYLFGIALILTGFVYSASYCAFTFGIKEKLEKLKSKYIYIPPSRDVATNMVVEKVLLLKHMAKQEEKEAKKK